MAEPLVIPGDMQCKGRGQFASLSIPAGTLTNAGVAADAAIAESKLVHMVNAPSVIAAVASAVVAASQDIYIAKGVGSLSAFRAYISTVATGADRTVTVDLHKSTAGGAFATVLSGTVGFTNGSTARTLVAGTISSAAYAAGDIFRVIVTVAGAAGNQAIGLTADLVAYEATT